MTVRLIHGDALEMLATLPAASVQTVVTSPPYFGLRRYTDDAREIGQEETPARYAAALVAVFRELRRVLRDDGTLWLNLGDSYAMNGTPGMSNLAELGKRYAGGGHKRDDVEKPARSAPAGIAPKNLLGIPWRVAFALQDDGWYLRSDIIWSKPNPMPESVTDRPTRSHEYLFLLSKQPRYYYDAAAIAEPSIHGEKFHGGYAGAGNRTTARNGRTASSENTTTTRNARTVWNIATQPFSGAHFATMPEALVAPCILAGSRAGDTVLDPFAGSGTVLRVAQRFQRDAIGIDLNADYLELQEQRNNGVQIEMDML